MECPSAKAAVDSVATAAVAMKVLRNIIFLLLGDCREWQYKLIRGEMALDHTGKIAYGFDFTS
jgi:hypothetical protein